MKLNDFKEFKKKDPMGVGLALRLFPDQIRECFTQSTQFDIPKYKFDSVLISGMGGSSNAAKIIESLVQADSKIPLVLYNDYGLPGWVNEDTLVVANSYSGNTEETLSAITEAKKRKSHVLGVTTGGKIGRMLENGELNGAIVKDAETNPTRFPKSGLGVSIGALIGVLVKAEVLPYFAEDINSAIDDLEEVRAEWLPENNETNNFAKKLAEFFQDSIPTLFGGRPFIGSLNAGRNVICEVGRTFGLFFDFPEVNHVLIEATRNPDFVREKVKYLFFDSSFNHERVRLRYEVTKNIFHEQGLKFETYSLRGKSALSQALEIPHLSAWVGYFLSMLRDNDPGPEPWILKLKESLAQPLH